MTARSPAEAVHQLVEPLQQAIACFANTVVNVRGGYYVSDVPHALRLGRLGDAVPLPGPAGIALAVLKNYRVVTTSPSERGWRAMTTGYSYALELESSSDGSAGRTEILRYDWHPASTPDRAFPHLHVYDIGLARLITGKMHLPTGHVTVADVLRLAVFEFGVEPLRGDWEAVLSRSEDAERVSWQPQ